MLDEQLSQRFLAVAGPAIELAKTEKDQSSFINLRKSGHRSSA